MSVKAFSQTGLATRDWSGPSPGRRPSVPWVRPADWLSLPAVTASDQKFVGLHAVYPDANFLALSAAGAYTVDWGDGVVENFAANAVAQHEYNYATYDVAGATLCSRGYKQVVVTVTPQSGQNLTFLNLHQRHTALSVQYSSGFLDIALSSQFLTDLRIGAQTPGGTAQNITFSDLERVNIVSSDLRTLATLFCNCYSLQSVVDISTSVTPPVTRSVTFTDVGDLVFSVSHNLRNGDVVSVVSLTSTTGLAVGSSYYVISATADTFQLSSTFGGSALALTTDGSGTLVFGTSMRSMFYNCYSLTTIPPLNTGSVIVMRSMFIQCVSLTSVPLLNTSSVIDMGNMFYGCLSLTSVPLLNTSSVIDMNGMFNGCYSLTSVTLLNTSSVTNMASMFYGCYSLTSVPLLNTSSVTNMANMFYQCYSLTSVPLLNTSSVTNMAYMFSSCYSMASVPLLNTSSVIDMSNMFFLCYSLTSVPALNVTSLVTANSMFGSCQSLSKVSLTNIKSSISVSSCKLNQARLEEVFGNLTTSTGQTITVTGNYGVDTAVTKSSLNTTAQTSTVLVTDTSGLSVGQYVSGTGTGITTGVTATTTVSTSIFTLANHGLPNGTRVSLFSLGTATGPTLKTIYYVVNSTSTTFQISTTTGGAPVTLGGTDSSVTIRYPSKITTISTNTSITLDTPAATTASATTLTFRKLDSTAAVLKGWTVTY